MASAPVKPRHSDESSCATINSNTRTPRRVQWAGDNDTRHDGYKQTSHQRDFCELDELALDPSVFETLTSALKRHQSGEPLRSERSPQKGKMPLKPSQAVVPLRIITSTPATHHSPLANPPVSSSGHPLTHSSGTRPYPNANGPVHASVARRMASFSLQSSPTDDKFNFSAPPNVARRTHDFPGEVWTDPLERKELPLHARIPSVGDRIELRSDFGRRSTWRRRSGDSSASSTEYHIEQLGEDQAAEVATSHTRRSWAWFHHLINTSKGMDEKGKATKHSNHHCHTHSDTENDCTDGEPHLPGRMRKRAPGGWSGSATPTPHGQPPLPPDQRPGQRYGLKLGNGVLSTLLALYDHNHDYDDDISMYGESIGSPKSDLPRLSYHDDHYDYSALEGRKCIKDEYLGMPSLGVSRKGGSTSSILGHIRSPSLPVTTTTAALIVGASALSGVAAPQHATLAPNLKRPGYNLMRYSVERFPKVVSRASSITFRGLRRAHSTDSGVASMDRRMSKEEWEEEFPDTPAVSVPVSPTTGSDGIIPRPKRGQTFPFPAAGDRKGWTGGLKDLQSPSYLPTTHYRALPSPWGSEKGPEPTWSGTTTPRTGEYTLVDDFSEKKINSKRIDREVLRERKERQRHREREIRLKRKKAEVYITKHVSEILQRQEFVLKLARAMIMFGGPSHRLTSQIQSTGRVLDLELSCMYLPDVMLLSFEDSATGTSNVKLIQQATALDLGKLGEAYALYWNVIHDDMSVSEASASLDALMRRKPLYNFIQLTLIGAMCSASICSVSFSGSFIDCLISAPLGGFLVAIQLTAVRNEIYAHVFEITIATLMSFLSAALASNKQLFCYPSVISSAVVLILPGYIVLSGSLELSSRCLVAGAVRICFSIMYSLFLGFGLALGADLYHRIVGGSVLGLTDLACTMSHDPAGPWWQQTPSLWWAFLTVPMYSLFLSLRLMAPWWKKELILSVAISSMGWVTNHFVGTKFVNQHDISAACGAFVVGFVSNIYGRFFNGNAFIVMITGILFQVPSGVGRGGLLDFASDQPGGSRFTFISGFRTSVQLIAVALGLTVGLGISLVVVHPVQSRRRAGGLFSL